jgi:tRNA threonylcarbamoyl adenosine modification protein (Sua5/YciO/YrdC/YwlC family)
MTRDPVTDAASAARAGRLIVFPTDTVYGIATRPDDASATSSLFEAKRRPLGLELPVLAASPHVLRTLASLDERAETLAAAFWPGPLTLVLPREPLSAGWELGGDRETIGVRVPRHGLALSILGAAGPLAVTSANISGRPPATTCQELQATFGDLVDIYLCEDKPSANPASSVVDLAHGPARLLRAGGASTEAIARLIGPLLDSGPSPA